MAAGEQHHQAGSDSCGNSANLAPRLSNADLRWLELQGTSTQTRLGGVQDSTCVLGGGGINRLLLEPTQRAGAGDAAAQKAQVAAGPSVDDVRWHPRHQLG